MEQSNNSETWSIVGSVGAALVAKSCCIGPLLLVFFGTGTAWAGHLSVLEAYRPLFMVVAVGLLLFAFYRAYGPTRAKRRCKNGEQCSASAPSRADRVGLWVATIAVMAVFASPYLVAFGGDNAANQPVGDNIEATEFEDGLATATLKIDGMTCVGCEPTVRRALQNVDGVDQIEVSYDPPRAHVVYDTSVTDRSRLTAAISDIGYSAVSVD